MSLPEDMNTMPESALQRFRRHGCKRLAVSCSSCTPGTGNMASPFAIVHSQRRPEMNGRSPLEAAPQDDVWDLHAKKATCCQCGHSLWEDDRGRWPIQTTSCTNSFSEIMSSAIVDSRSHQTNCRSNSHQHVPRQCRHNVVCSSGTRTGCRKLCSKVYCFHI